MKKQIHPGRKPGYTWDEETRSERDESAKRPCTVDGKTIYPSVVALIAALGNGKKGYKSPDFRYV